MNKIREKIKEQLFNNSKSDVDAIMTIIEQYLEEAFDAAKEIRCLGCGDYENMYYNWKTWYDDEINTDE